MGHVLLITGSFVGAALYWLKKTKDEQILEEKRKMELKALQIRKLLREISKIDLPKQRAIEVAEQNARLLEMALKRDQELARQREEELARQRARDLAKQRAKELAKQRAKELAQQRERELAEQQARDIAEQRARDLEEQRVREIAEQRAREQQARQQAQQHAIEMMQQRIRILAQQRALARAWEVQLARERELAAQHARMLAQQRARELAQQRAREQRSRELAQQRAREMARRRATERRQQQQLPTVSEQDERNTNQFFSRSLHDEECSICIDPLKAERRVDQKPILMLTCGHAFHNPCVRRWLRNNTVCPVCRAEVTLRNAVFVTYKCVPMRRRQMRRINAY